MNTLLIIVVAVVIIAGCAKYLQPKDPYSGPRDTIHYGYYGDMAFQFEETKDHVNTVWIAAWDRHPLAGLQLIQPR